MLFVQIVGTVVPGVSHTQSAARETVLLPFLMIYSHTLISLSQRKTALTAKIKKNK
jgi:hypothetical protein